MVQLRWTQLAVEDLKSIYEYIARDSKTYAQRQVVKLKLRTAVLKTFPETGKVVAEFSHHNYRELVEGDYRIIYKIVSNEQIDILTVHHGAKNLSNIVIE